MDGVEVAAVCVVQLLQLLHAAAVLDPARKLRRVLNDRKLPLLPRLLLTWLPAWLPPLLLGPRLLPKRLHILLLLPPF